MASVKHYNGDIELTRVHAFIRGFGESATVAPVWNLIENRWVRTFLPVQRSIEFKTNPSRHECDARCTNATGLIMKCECSCGGKNHGKYRFNCTAEAA